MVMRLPDVDGLDQLDANPELRFRTMQHPNPDEQPPAPPPEQPSTNDFYGPANPYFGPAYPQPQQDSGGVLLTLGHYLGLGSEHPAQSGQIGSGGLIVPPSGMQSAYNTANVDVPYYSDFARNTLQPGIESGVNSVAQMAGIDSQLPGQLASSLVPVGAADLGYTASALKGPAEKLASSEFIRNGEEGFIKLPFGGSPEKPWGRPRELGPQIRPPTNNAPAFDEHGNPLPGFDERGNPKITQGEMQGQEVSGPAALGPSAGGPWSVVRGLITQSEPLPAETEYLRGEVRGQRLAQAQSILESDKGTPTERMRQYRNTLFQQGEMPRTTYPNVEPQLAPGVLDQLHSDIGSTTELDPWERARAVDALDKLLRGDLTQMQENELRLLDKVANPSSTELSDAIRAKQIGQAGVDPQFTDYLMSLYRTPSKFLTYLHGVFLKPGFGVAANPMNWRETRTSIADYFRAFKDAKAGQFIRDRNASLNFLGAEDPEFASYQPRNMGYNKQFQQPTQTAIDRAVDTIPGLKASGRAVGQYLSSLRDLVYNKEAQRLFDSGERDPASFKALYETLSHQTGFGMPGRGPATTPLFSLQHFTGRWKALIDPLNKPGSINPLGVGARPAAIRNLLTIFGISAGITETAKALGLPTDIGSVKSPLGTVKLGYTSIQPSSGYNSMVRLTEKLARAIAAGTGEAVGVNLGPTIGSEGLKSVIADYMRGQFGPVSDLGLNLLTGQDWKGNKYNLLDEAKKNGLADLWAPIAAREIWDAVKANGPVGALEASPALGAETVSTNVPVADQRAKAMADLGLPGSYEALSKEDKKRVNDSIDFHPSQRMSLQLNDVDKATEAIKRYSAYQSPDAWVQYKNFFRALNESDKSAKAWGKSSDLIAKYEKVADAHKEEVAQQRYKKPFDQLTSGEQNTVIGDIHTAYRKARPELDAWLAYWGGSKTVESTEAGKRYEELLKEYTKDGKGPAVKLAKGAK